MPLADINRLSTAAGIWMTAAVGMAVGAGRVWLPVLGVTIAVVIVALLGYYRIGSSPADDRDVDPR